MTHAEIKTFLQQAGLVGADGGTLNFEGVLRIAVSHEVPIVEVAAALGWDNARAEDGAETLIYWQMQQAIDAGPPARAVRAAWEVERGIAPSMFNRIYERFAGHPVPEESVAAAVVIDHSHDVQTAGNQGQDGRPLLGGLDLLAHDAAMLGQAEDDMLRNIVATSLEKGASLPDIRAMLVAKYGVTEERLQALSGGPQ